MCMHVHYVTHTYADESGSHSIQTSTGIESTEEEFDITADNVTDHSCNVSTYITSS